MQLQRVLGKIDIYLLDQILKNRYLLSQNILDAGCGSGRNLHWFIANGYAIEAIDINNSEIALLKELYPSLENKFNVAELDNLPFTNTSFDHIICSAVLHFAKNETHFKNMLGELVRVLKIGGTIFIRMATDIGVENKIKPLGKGLFYLPDNSVRFLLTVPLLEELMLTHNLSFIDPFKSVYVHNQRSMSTLILRKEA
ncbi:class I SAM-dependent methyltransferase [Maribacter sp.]|uniref:class I SAM-dependent methyltransferase n=1 Tax=Maribacter sp. TaxID=1897614 RepID=UPI0025BA8144|nr:class I SAM-dependent methyltransferase [Maribacter sp.]